MVIFVSCDKEKAEQTVNTISKTENELDKEENTEPKIAYKDAFVKLIMSFYNGEQEESMTNTFSFIDINYDGVNEVFFYYTSGEYLIDQQDYPFILYEYHPNGGFKQVYKQSMTELGILKSNRIQTISKTELLHYGPVDENGNPMKNNYVFTICADWLELTEPGQSYSVFEITNQGVNGLFSRVAYPYHPENNQFQILQGKNNQKLVSEQEYFTALENRFDQPSYYLEPITIPKKKYWKNPEEVRGFARYLLTEDKENQEYKESKGYEEDDGRWNEYSDFYFNIILYNEYNWQEYGKSKELSSEEELLFRGNYVRDCIVAQNDVWLFYLGGDGIIREPLDWRFDKKELISTEKGVNLALWQDYLYYEKEHSIYRMKFDGSAQERLVDGKFAQIYKNWIYFTTYGEQNGIWKMRADGSEVQMLCESAAYCVNVADDYIYYLDCPYTSEAETTEVWPRGKMYRMKKDGTDLKLIYDWEVSNLMYDNGKLYFAQDNLIHWAYVDFYQINSRVLGSDRIEIFAVNDNNIVWYDEANIYGGSMDGDAGRMLQREVDVDNIFITPNTLFYLQYDRELEEFVLIRMVDSNPNSTESLCIWPKE